MLHLKMKFQLSFLSYVAVGKSILVNELLFLPATSEKKEENPTSVWFLINIKYNTIRFFKNKIMF